LYRFYALLLDLHSFPTRRSSDLPASCKVDLIINITELTTELGDTETYIIKFNITENRRRIQITRNFQIARKIALRIFNGVKRQPLNRLHLQPVHVQIHIKVSGGSIVGTQKLNIIIISGNLHMGSQQLRTFAVHLYINITHGVTVYKKVCYSQIRSKCHIVLQVPQLCRSVYVSLCQKRVLF